MIIDSIKLLTDIAKSLWNEKEEIKEKSFEERHRIASACLAISEKLSERRDLFIEKPPLSGRPQRMIQNIEAPFYVRAMRDLLRGTLPEEREEKYLQLLSTAADTIASVEKMGRQKFKELTREERDALIEPLNEAIGEFQALSEAMGLRRN